jgi:hypothetical protein
MRRGWRLIVRWWWWWRRRRRQQRGSIHPEQQWEETNDHAEFYAFYVVRGDKDENPTKMILAHTLIVVFGGRLAEVVGGAMSSSEEAPLACL